MKEVNRLEMPLAVQHALTGITLSPQEYTRSCVQRRLQGIFTGVTEHRLAMTEGRRVWSILAAFENSNDNVFHRHLHRSMHVDRD